MRAFSCSATRRSSATGPCTRHMQAAQRASDAAGAAGAYKRAIALTANGIERAGLERRLRALR
jgi:hypothetical protein